MSKTIGIWTSYATKFEGFLGDGSLAILRPHNAKILLFI